MAACSKPSFAVKLVSPGFLDRIMFSREQNMHLQREHIACSYCNNVSLVTFNKSSSLLKCDGQTHMLSCSECKDYNLEKLIRCQNCCTRITGRFPQGCSPGCPRNYCTIKATALCAVCGSHLRKEARCCKTSIELKQIKKLLRSYITVLVQNPALISNPTPQERPCSHYTLCQFCKSSITKGHRSSTSCKLCRKSKKRSLLPILETEQGPPLKKLKISNSLIALAAMAETFQQAEEFGSLSTLSPPPPPQEEELKKENLPSPQMSRFGAGGGIPVWRLLNISDKSLKINSNFF